MRILLATTLLLSNVTLAANCEEILQSVKTMRDARTYFLCVAEQTPNGAIFAWDAVIRDAYGTPTGTYRQIPDGWQICNGENGTPDLKGMFLMGADSIKGSGIAGGRAKIEDSGVHAHSGTTGVTRGPDHKIGCTGKCSGGRTAAHNHAIEISDSGIHSHGSNLPPYYTVNYICKVSTPLE